MAEGLRKSPVLGGKVPGIQAFSENLAVHPPSGLPQSVGQVQGV